MVKTSQKGLYRDTVKGLLSFIRRALTLPGDTCLQSKPWALDMGAECGLLICPLYTIHKTRVHTSKEETGKVPTRGSYLKSMNQVLESSQDLCLGGSHGLH